MWIFFCVCEVSQAVFVLLLLMLVLLFLFVCGSGDKQSLTRMPTLIKITFLKALPELLIMLYNILRNYSLPRNLVLKKRIKNLSFWETFRTWKVSQIVWSNYKWFFLHGLDRFKILDDISKMLSPFVIISSKVSLNLAFIGIQQLNSSKNLGTLSLMYSSCK